MQIEESKKIRDIYTMRLAVFLLIVPFFKPVGIAAYPMVNSVFIAWKLISITILVFLFIRNLGAIKFSKWEASAVLFLLIYSIGTIAFSGNIADWVIDAVSASCVILLVQICFSRDKVISLLGASCDLFRILIVCHLISAIYIRFAGPLFQVINNDYVYLLGTDNYSAFSMLPFFLVLFISHSLIHTSNKQKKFDLVLFIGTITYLILVQSLSGAGAFLVFGALVFLYKRISKFPFLLQPIPFLVVLIVILVSIVGFQAHLIVGDILIGTGKGLSLNSRTEIWSGAIQLIMVNPLFGYGITDSYLANEFLLYGAGHAHNLILDILLRGGLLGAFFYLYFFLEPFSRLVSLDKKRTVWYMLSFFVAYGTLTFMDFYPLHLAPIFAISIVHYYGDKILAKGELVA